VRAERGGERAAGDEAEVAAAGGSHGGRRAVLVQKGQHLGVPGGVVRPVTRQCLTQTLDIGRARVYAPGGQTFEVMSASAGGVRQERAQAVAHAMRRSAIVMGG
jgi:hypothetical protein